MRYLQYILLLISLCWISPFDVSAQNVRVLLSQSSQIKIAATSSYRLVTDKGLVLKKDAYLPLTMLKYDLQNGWYLSDQHLGQSDILYFETTEDSSLVCGSKRYRGLIELRVSKTGRQFDTINHLDLEPYLRGVVSREMSARWPETALEVQAIVARTYTLDRIPIKKYPHYDMHAGVDSQVYGGVLAEYPSTNRAVDRTRNLVLRYGNDLITTYYHSACAGRTEASHHVWSVKSPPLQGVVCQFCKKSGQQDWRVTLSGRDMSKKLLSFPGAQKSDVKTIKVWDKTISKRVRWLEVIYQNGTSIKMSGNTFRLKLGADKLRSTKFVVTQKKKNFEFYGHGWGHGVGLCQWGTKFMADEGYSMKEILQHYYPGTLLGTV